MAGGTKLQALELQERIGNYEQKLEYPPQDLKCGYEDDHSQAAMIDSPEVLMKGFKDNLPKQGQLLLLYLKKQVHRPTNLEFWISVAILAAMLRLPKEGRSNHNSVIRNHRALDKMIKEENPDKDDSDCSGCGCCSIM